jgi:hypothetical protein
MPKAARQSEEKDALFAKLRATQESEEMITKEMERKQMNILIEDLPEKVEIEGEEIEINTDYRNVLLYFRVLREEELEDREKLEIAARLFFKRIPRNVEEGMRYINEEYIVCSETQASMTRRNKIKRSVEKEKLVFDFEQDGGLIYVSFWQEYGIDLRKEKMHWYVFKALFDGLGEETVLRRVIEFRKMKPKDMPRDRRLELMELQRELSIEVKDFSGKSAFNYNDNGSAAYRRRAKEIEKELLEGLKNG